MNTSKLLQIVGLGISLCATGLALHKAEQMGIIPNPRNALSSIFSKEPFKLENADFGGNMYNKEDGTVQCAFYRSDGLYQGAYMPNRVVVKNDDKKFDQAKAYDAKGPHLQGKYNVLGYTTFLGENVATNITPVRATSN